MSSHNSYTSESSANASIKNTVSTDNQAAGNKPTVNELAQSLNKIVSEGRNPDTLDIDTLSTEGILARINNEDAKVANAVTSQIPQIGKAVDAATTSIKNGGRLIYIGAGTSGRLGILDAVECRPTFSVPDELVVGVIAGGEKAIQHAVEGAEDDVDAGRADLVALSLNHNDTVIGISASGRTPYVSGALEYARSLGCFTGAIACSPNAAIFTNADVNSNLLKTLLKRAVANSFNAITVDGDQSTNDMVSIFSTRSIKIGQNISLNDKVVQKFELALKKLCLNLAKQIVVDGEGAKKFLTINVINAKSLGSAKNIAFSIANSPLVKTAVAGEDPNWGRIIMGIGKSGEIVDPKKLKIKIGDYLVADNGKVSDIYDEKKLKEYMEWDSIEIEVNLKLGNDAFKCYTCDFTHDYININADYRN